HGGLCVDQDGAITRPAVGRVVAGMACGTGGDDFWGRLAIVDSFWVESSVHSVDFLGCAASRAAQEAVAPSADFTRAFGAVIDASGGAFAQGCALSALDAACGVDRNLRHHDGDR